MATFDEKEFLYDIYNSVRVCISNAKRDNYTPEMLNDIKLINEFRNQMVSKKPDEINHEEALAFFKIIKSKYEVMPDKW